MNNIQAFRVLTTKTLAIIGFVATIVLLVWLSIEGIKRLPDTFASLASITESISNYRPTRELTLATEKTVVNSAESFVVSWTDVKQSGTYQFGYACISGVTLEVRTPDSGDIKTFPCTETLSLPEGVTTLTVSAVSKEARFIHVPLILTFSSSDETTQKSETAITVVNATVPIQGIIEETAVDETDSVPTAEPETPAPKPVTTIVYPQSNPYGYTDLSITVIGIGTLKDGIFTYTGAYDRDERSAFRFDVKNIGTKTSDTWTFKTILPSGDVYESPVQVALKPNEHIELTLGFDVGEDTDDFAKITNTLYTNGDANAKNNTSVWYMIVED